VLRPDGEEIVAILGGFEGLREDGLSPVRQVGACENPKGGGQSGGEKKWNFVFQMELIFQGKIQELVPIVQCGFVQSIRVCAPGVGSFWSTWRWFVLVQSVCEPVCETVRAGSRRLAPVCSGMLWYNAGRAHRLSIFFGLMDGILRPRNSCRKQ